MSEKKINPTTYSIVNLLFLSAAAAYYFIHEKANMNILLFQISPAHFCILLMTVILVHFIKALRLYIEMYGLQIPFSMHLKSYCKVTPVSIILPWKIGDLYRMYCWSILCGDYMKGIIYILFDRFIDTAALITVMLAVIIYYRGRISSIAYLLSIAFLLILMTFFTFSGVTAYWKKSLLRSKATPGKLRTLEILDLSRHVFKDIERLMRSRGLLLYLMSLCAWGIEIGILILSKNPSASANDVLLTYLSAAIGTDTSTELMRFVFLSILFLILLYVLIKIFEIFFRKRQS